MGLAFSAFASLTVARAGNAPLPPTNLRIGTGGSLTASGMTFPGATSPFGMVRLSPDTEFGSGPLQRLNGTNLTTSGYSEMHNRVTGFSHTRLSGTGVKEGGLLKVKPVTIEKDYQNRSGSLGLEHDQESMEPGHYAITFPGDKIFAELTSSQHCGFHRYRRLDATKTLHLVIDGGSSLSRGGIGSASFLQVDPAHQAFWGDLAVKGGFSSRYGGMTAHVYAEYTGAVQSVRMWQGKDWENATATRADGNRPGLGIALAPSGDEIELKVCLSYVSASNARGNFEAEARHADFDQALSAATQAWHSMLGRAVIQTSDPDVEKIFYTSLYHSLLMPTNFTDTNHEYLGFDRVAHRAEGFTYRTDLSLWDTFRTAHPLYTLIAPEVQHDSVMSLLAMGAVSGVLPRWPSGGGDAGSMFGSPANFLMSEAWLKGIHNFDAEAALDLMVRGADEEVAGKPGREKICHDVGYCPSNLVNGSVSKTLEYAWADFATAELAKSLGHSGIATDFATRSEAYREVWDPDAKYFAPRDEKGHFGRISPDALPYLGIFGHGTSAFVEGSANQWRYSAPQAGSALVKLFGGPTAFVAELERFMEGHSGGRAAIYPGGRYWQGNEPDLHALYFFNEAGRPDLTQKWARWAMNDRYGNSSAGLDGNDDGGALSAWYVLSALGLYPQAGTDRYWLGSPIVEKATLNLGSQHQLHLVVNQQGRQNVYVQKLLVNGHRWCKPSIAHSELIGATLQYTMGSTPAPDGGYACP